MVEKPPREIKRRRKWKPGTGPKIIQRPGPLDDAVPDYVRKYTCRMAEAWRLWAESYGQRTDVSIAREVGCHPAYISMLRKRDDWGARFFKTIEATAEITNPRVVESLSVEAQRLRSSHVKLGDKAQQAANALFEEIGEWDEGGNLVELKEVVVGVDKEGNPVTKRVGVEELSKLVNTLKGLWQLQRSYTGEEARERLQHKIAGKAVDAGGTRMLSASAIEAVTVAAEKAQTEAAEQCFEQFSPDVRSCEPSNATVIDSTSKGEVSRDPATE